MAYCTIQEIRDSNDKLADANDVTPADIDFAIATAQRIVKTKLGKLMSPDEIDAIGAESNAIRSLTISKAVEKALVKKFGAKRKEGESSDVDYLKKEFKDLLDAILDGEIPIDIPDTSGGESVSVTKRYPKLSGQARNKKMYPRKGVPDFFPDGVSTSYVDDPD
jgi:hypothetical protein